MSKVEFSKYPKVPSAQHYPLPAGSLVVQEKLDGANTGLELTADGQLIIHSRTRALAYITSEGVVPIVADMGSFSAFAQYIWERFEGIYRLMNVCQIEHLYGEWLTKHTLDYPEEMWRQFYVFDMVSNGRYFNPMDLPEYIWATGLEIVKSQGISPPDIETAGTMVDHLMAEWGRERRIEGVVIKSYKLDAKGELDGWGQRYAYKRVLPEFKEDHRNNPMFPDAPEALSTEQRLVACMPERSLEKTLQKVCDARGGWRPQYFPLLLAMAWQEFLEEHAATAFKDLHHPLVNIRTLKGEVERRAREYALAHAQVTP